MPTTLETSPQATVRTLATLVEELGDIPLNRIRLIPAPGTATEQDVLRVEDEEGLLCELVDGVLVEKGMAYYESVLASYLIELLNAFVRPKNLGLVSGESGMMRLFPNLVRIPDVAFASWNRFPKKTRRRNPIPAIVPDLAVEILSASNTKKEMARKRREYFEAGLRLLWIIDPDRRKVEVYQSVSDKPSILTEKDELTGGNVLPGFKLPLKLFFAELDRLVNDS